MANFIRALLKNDKYPKLEGYDSLYKLSMVSGINKETLLKANKKQVDQLSAKNIRLMSEALDMTPGELLDQFYKIEKQQQVDNPGYMFQVKNPKKITKQELSYLNTLEYLEEVHSVIPATKQDLNIINQLDKKDNSYTIQDGKVWNEAGTYVADIVNIELPNEPSKE